MRSVRCRTAAGLAALVLAFVSVLFALSGPASAKTNTPKTTTVTNTTQSNSGGLSVLLASLGKTVDTTVAGVGTTVNNTVLALGETTQALTTTVDTTVTGTTNVLTTLLDGLLPSGGSTATTTPPPPPPTSPGAPSSGSTSAPSSATSTPTTTPNSSLTVAGDDMPSLASHPSSSSDGAAHPSAAHTDSAVSVPQLSSLLGSFSVNTLIGMLAVLALGVTAIVFGAGRRSRRGRREA